MRYIRTGSSSDSPAGIASSASSSRSASGFSSFCSSTISMPDGGDLFEELVDPLGADSSSVSKAVLISSYVSEPALLAARDQLLDQLFERDRRRASATRRRFSCVPSFSSPPFSVSCSTWRSWTAPLILLVSTTSASNSSAELRGDRLAGSKAARRSDATSSRYRAPLVVQPQALDRPVPDARAVLRESAKRTAPSVRPRDRARRAVETRLDPPRKSAEDVRRLRTAPAPLRRSARRCAGSTALRKAPARDALAIFGDQARLLEQHARRPPARTRAARPSCRSVPASAAPPACAARSLRCRRGTGYSEGRRRSPAAGRRRKRASDPILLAAPGRE